MSHSRPRGSGRSGERGAALLQMSIAMLAITAFSTFVMDYGVFWVARRQAQNAADAGALAGAIAVAFGEDAAPGGAAVLGAQATARANVVWGVPPSVVVGGLNGTTDVAVEACPDRPAHQCVRTDVYRTTERGNPLPTYSRPPGGDRHAGRAGDGDRRGDAGERVELRAALGHCGPLARRRRSIGGTPPYPHMGRRSRRLHASKREARRGPGCVS